MDRIAIVTGGGRGIGAATCRELARQGLRVAVADINAMTAQALVNELGKNHLAFEVDVSQERGVEKLFNDVERTMGSPAVLVCAAGGPFIKPGEHLGLADTSLDNWVLTEALNGRGVFLCVREYLRRRRKAPLPDGRIVNISSLSAFSAYSITGVSYGAAKAAVIAITRHAAVEGAPFGITANAIAPGMIDTPAVRANSPDSEIEEVARRIPVGRIGTADEVAALVGFLASPKAGYITGATFDINGGIRIA